MNFGETLSYWYLRLNGFIPMRNFVLHRANIEARQSADTDLLAIRFPDVYEEIGGKPVDWDHDRFEGWGLDLHGPIALIVEVKTGAINPDNRWWRVPRLRAGILRLGIIARDDVNEVATRLENVNEVGVGDWVIGKLLVSEESRDGPWFNLTLSEADEFISNRIRRYKQEKDADRLRFPDDLMQYFSWKVQP